ncbi:MAG: tetratricopeptide repeat protein [Anaerolineae bacterium]|nr:tetratricopeptide repeat protein [Anaerolineae bacterium]
MKKFIALILIGILLTLAVPLHAQDGPPPAASLLEMGSITHIYQNWNNCGPATVTMGLSYFGYTIDRSTQENAADYLKPTGEDVNVSPWQLAEYVNEVMAAQIEVRALDRPAGDPLTLKRLLAAGFPVIIEKGFEVTDTGWMGHYVLLVGYDDAAGVWLTYDSYEGPGSRGGLPQSYAYIEEMWQQFNNRFIVLYAPQREAEVQTILGDLWEEQLAWERAKATAQANAAIDVADKWAWFNLGEAMTALGEYEFATVAFRQALDIGMPFRTLWYMHGPFEAFYQTGQWQALEGLARSVLTNTSYLEEVNYYRGLAFAAQGDTANALFHLNQALSFNPNFTLAREAKLAIESGAFVPPAALSN